MNLNKPFKMTIVATSVALMTACSGIMHKDPYDPNGRHVNKILVGTGAGTAVGALGGSLWCGTPCAWILGAIGAITGGFVGFVLEEIEEGQKYELINAGVKIKKDSKTGEYVFDLPELSFALGSSNLNAESIEAIKALSKIIKAKNYKVIIAGFASPDGAEDFNLKLSQARADKMLEAFVLEGVSREDIQAKGMGENAVQGRSGSVLLHKKQD